MIPYEDLSRLLAGDLSEDEARALRARIEAEPAVAAALADLQQLSSDLAHLPEVPPPAALDTAVLAEPAAPPLLRPANSRPWLTGAAGLVVGLAAASLLMLRPVPPSEIHIVAGDELVDGAVAVLAGGRRVEVDGLARIVVEPQEGMAREWEANPEDPMSRTTAITAATAAAAGAIVTVVVFEGRAKLFDTDQGAIELHAGDTHRTAGMVPTGRRVPPPAAPLPDGATDAQTITHLQDRVAQLEQSLSEAEFTGKLAHGQLVAHIGEPQPWPTDVLPDLEPEAYEQRIAEALEGVEGATLAELDCSEYPCIAVLQPTDLSDGWEDRLKLVPEAVAEGVDGPMALSVFASKFDDDEGGEAGLMGFVVAPPEDSHRDTEVGARMFYRADDLMQELGTDLMSEDSEQTEQ